MSSKSGRNGICSFDFAPGRVFARKYEIIHRLGVGWEGEVYLARERSTGIERTAKFLYPHRNPGGKTSTVYAQKLFKLRHCPILIPYHLHDEIRFQGETVTFLVSDFIEGESLKAYLKQQRGQRLPPFQALHLLYALVIGMEPIHKAREYHGDLHMENVMVRKVGLEYDLKVFDLFDWGRASRDNIQGDICDLIKIFYDTLGGKRTYAQQPPEVKYICCGLKRGMILKKFPTTSRLREHLENLTWQ